MVVVAVVRLPALPFLLVCENSVCGGLVLVLVVGLGLVADEMGKGSVGDVDVTEVEVEMLGGWSNESAASLLSGGWWGDPAVMVVSTD